MAILGSTVDPRLGAVNPAAIQALSQAGAASGQMYANIGSSIAGVIQDQAQRKTDAGIAQIIDEATIDEFDEEGNRTGFRTLDQSKFRKLVSDRKLPPAQANAILQDTLDAWKTEAELIAMQRKIDLDNQTDNRRIDATMRGQDLTTQTTQRGQDIDKEVAFAGFRSREGMQEKELSSLERRLGMSLASQEGISSARIASEEKMTAAKLELEKELNEANNNVKTYLAEMDDATRKELGFAGLKNTMTIAEMNIGSEMEMLEQRLENATASDKRQIRADMQKLDKTLAQNDRHFNKEIKLARKELKQEGTLFRERLSFDKDLANQKDKLARDLSEDEITARFREVNTEIAARKEMLRAELNSASERDRVKIRAEMRKLERTQKQNLKIHNDRMSVENRKLKIDEAIGSAQVELMGSQKGEVEARTKETLANTEMIDPTLSKSKMLNDYTSGLSAENKALFMGMSPADQLRNIEIDVDIAEASRDIGLRDQLVALHNSLKFDAQRNARMSGQPMPQLRSFGEIGQAPAEQQGFFGRLGDFASDAYGLARDYNVPAIADRFLSKKP
tara:strand:- start:10910 stop:12598 length:1689 start_codon:yes stop_codon:yes gene_type:complete